MLKKYKLSVKSFQETKHSGRTYDIIVGQQELRDINASHSQYCNYCKCSAKCPYYFDEYQNYSPHINCLKSYNLFFSTFFIFISFLVIMSIPTFINYTIGIPIIVIILIALCFTNIMSAGNYIEGILLLHENKEEEKKKSILENNFSKISPSSLYFKKISKAKENVKITKKLWKSNNWESCNELIKKYVESLEKIIKIVDDDNSAYPRVSSLFETGVPEIYKILVSYLELSATNCVNSETEKTLNSTLSKFLNYMEKVEKEAILNSSEDIAKINFKASNEFISTWINIK